jgi:hypothetical protein
MTRAFPTGLCIFLLLLTSACANSHFFPRLHPLFPGLDESRLSDSSRRALGEAKVDFWRLKHGMEPQYANLARTLPDGHSKVYNGRGYRLTLRSQRSFDPYRIGPEIVIFASLTGGCDYSYDELEETE